MSGCLSRGRWAPEAGAQVARLTRVVLRCAFAGVVVESDREATITEAEGDAGSLGASVRTTDGGTLRGSIGSSKIVERPCSQRRVLALWLESKSGRNNPDKAAIPWIVGC